MTKILEQHMHIRLPFLQMRKIRYPRFQSVALHTGWTKEEAGRDQQEFRVTKNESIISPGNDSHRECDDCHNVLEWETKKPAGR